MSTNISSITQQLYYSIENQKNSIILEQLNDLISRGLLIVEMTEPVLVTEYSKNYTDFNVKLMQQVKLTLKDKEYIEKLEKENTELRGKLEVLKKALAND